MSDFSDVLDDPGLLDATNVCLYPLSKNVEGDLEQVGARTDECPAAGCLTLKAAQRLYLKVGTNEPCDSTEALALSGDMEVLDVVAAFANADGWARGLHTGRFRWTGAGALATGRWSGVINAGTHRKPAFRGCQECHQPGVLEGRLWGVVEAGDPLLNGAAVVASYRITFQPSESGGTGPLTGSLEGLLVALCP